MEVVTGAMGTLLPKLDDLITEEYNLQKNLKNDIRFLKAELEIMEATLVKVSEAPIDQPADNQVKLWARDVKDLSYDIEDSIDEFMVRIDNRVQLHSFGGFIDRIRNFITKAMDQHKIASNIKEIKSLIKEVSERHDRYKVDVPTKIVHPTVDSRRLPALYKRERELVGTDEKIHEVVKKLMEEDHEMSKKHTRIVSIVGFAGIGKTAIARVVYERLKMDFDCDAFVSVSLTPNMEMIFKDMLHELDKDKYCNIYQQAWTEERLLKQLREFLRDKRCVYMAG